MAISTQLQIDVIAGSVTVGVASFVAVLLRIKARRLRRVPLAIDDMSAIVAMLLSWGVVIGNIIATHYGLGRSIQDLSFTGLVKLFKVFFASQILWAIAVPAVKVSILTQYLRIFDIVTYMRLCARMLLGFSLAWGVMVVVVLLTKCQPLAYTWDKSLDGRCIDETLFYKVGTATNVVGDFLILILPMPAIWSLRIELGKKLQLIGVFFIASMSCAFSTARFVALFQIEGVDPTIELAVPCIWSAVEPCLGIVAASLATTGPIIQHLKEKFPRRDLSQSSTLVARTPGTKDEREFNANSIKGAFRLGSTEHIALSHISSPAGEHHDFQTR